MRLLITTLALLSVTVLLTPAIARADGATDKELIAALQSATAGLVKVASHTDGAKSRAELIKSYRDLAHTVGMTKFLASQNGLISAEVQNEIKNAEGAVYETGLLLKKESGVVTGS